MQIGAFNHRVPQVSASHQRQQPASTRNAVPLRVHLNTPTSPHNLWTASQRCTAAVSSKGASSSSSAAVSSGSSSKSSNSSNGASHPSSAETARTIVDLVAHGTLCTISDDGIPLGTYVSYVLDEAGQPILRLRADAVHTLNLKVDPKCSLFVQPADYPARLLARVTLIGQIEEVSTEVAESAAALHDTMHMGGVGVDAPSPSDLYYRLNLDRCFYVGQLAGASKVWVGWTGI